MKICLTFSYTPTETTINILQSPNPWCVMTILIIVSHDVADIQELIGCLTVSVSRCTALEVIESLYCIATLLYAFKLAKKHDVWNR